ncbi:hypothetical protein HMPREF0202_02310 [Cetobacterium somerae ATCC BAA-474]|uniref:Uncharacterized protein n=1 Tax=Cetobacterium somerae ATCC BAA-474 TaxID=1319815 RepID=U7V8Z2_9FUSO|nr:hypothetical protein HMPREF0202_02310 [Cetobacterium somerae ATCC BAA-474]
MYSNIDPKIIAVKNPSINFLEKDNLSIGLKSFLIIYFLL